MAISLGEGAILPHSMIQTAVTKADLVELRTYMAELRTDLAELRSWLLWRMVLIAGVCVAVSERLSRT